MKRIFSGTLLCTLLLNSFVSGVYATEILTKTSQTSETITTDPANKSVIQSTSTTDAAIEAEISETSTNTSESSSTETTATISSTDSSQEDSATTESSIASSETTPSTTDAPSSAIDPKEDAEIGKQGTNHEKGTYAMRASNNGIAKRSVGIAQVYANDPNLPKKDFIDVSSWNGTISVAEYQKIKSYGVTGVSVKLTEGTSYTNPYAQSQINNAKAAGLSVSAYHYSLYTSIQTAQAEAKYFAQAATNLGLSKSTIMFNDAEDPTLTNNGRNAQANSLAFNQQLKNLGFSNDALYVGRYWIDSGYINPTSFGKERVWVAQYPYTPDQTMQWNNDYGAWQWSSLMYFPGLANYQTRAFDISMSYSSFFGTTNTGPNLNNYYTTNPGRVIVKKNDCFYNDVNFTSPGMTVKENTLVTVKSVQTTASGIPRLFTDHGYLTANKDYVVAAQSNIDSYFTTNPQKVRLKADDYFYADTAFTQRLNKVAKGTVVEVEGLAYTDSGIFRLKTKYGYLTANKSLVEQYKELPDMYYMSNPGQVITKTNDKFYKDVEFTKAGEAVTAGTVLKVTGIEMTKSGIPRLKTDKGYYTANKDYVVATIASINNYYTKNPMQVVLKTNDTYYRDIDFLHKGNSVAKGTLVAVTGVVYRENDVPRLLTPNGYLTANKAYVQEVPSNIANYYYTNPGYVVMKANDTYYKDVDFSQKGEAVSKNELIEVQDIVFTNSGIPRLKTAKGYLTANKSYVTKLVNNSENYFIENPRKIVMLRDDRYYSDIDFKQPGASISKGTTIDILGIEYTASGVPRLKTANGYVTANKGYVTAAANSNGNYFVTNPKKIQLLVDDCYYNDVNFTQKGASISKGTIVTIQSIEYTASGMPRLKTSNGYITANKAYVQKVN
jgi:GH25 family lysozyme M1 (1,4-beta-N-acetylmuramidase)